LTEADPSPADTHCLEPDWKLSKWGAFEGIEGNDIAGYVERVGKNVSTFKVGDKAGSFTPMRTHDKYGAYQATTVTTEHTSFHIGKNTSFDQAAAFPLAVLTAAIGLFVNLKVCLYALKRETPLLLRTSGSSNSLSSPTAA
jgi:NADPH:quinone reductase-like Zn-dependent oxidoreductase